MTRLKSQNDLCIFFVVTEDEINKGELEACMYKYLDILPSKEYKCDFFIFINKMFSRKKIDRINEWLTRERFVKSVSFINLSLTEEEDCFWYPWAFSEKIKPLKKPDMGYTAGANLLFYRAIDTMLESKYKNFLMLECDTRPLEKYWFDEIRNFSIKEKFEIAGSTYKGSASWHSESEYKDHINGVAIYKNSKRTKILINSSSRAVVEYCKKDDYLNFDVANLIAKNQSRRKDPYILKDSGVIVNYSDPADLEIQDKEILNKHKKAVIVHQKRKKHIPILDPTVFDKDYEKSIPVFFCKPKCATEYTISANKMFLDSYCLKTKSNPVVLKCITNEGSKLILFCEAIKKFNYLPKTLFKETIGDNYYLDAPILHNLILNNYVNVFSMCIDFRFSVNNVDESLFYIFNSILDRLKVNPFIYSFNRDPFCILKSSFPDWESVNFQDIKCEPQEKRRRFNLFSTLFPSSFFQKKLIGSNYSGKEDQKNHFFTLMETFNIFDVSLVDESLDKIFNHFYNLSIWELPNINQNINPTKNIYNIDKATFLKAKVAQDIWAQRSKEDLQIYKEFTVTSVESDMDKIKKIAKKINYSNQNIPVFFHIPKNAGTFVIATMNKYFMRTLGVKQEDFNLQRLGVRTTTGHEIKIFVYFKDESWKKDKDIHVLDKFGPMVRARNCSLETFSRYLYRDQIKLLACVVEPVGDVLDLRPSFNALWDILEKAERNPVNFCLVRNPYDRASSIYNYLSSEESSHERTHGAFDHIENFRQFIKSPQMEDSWLIRALTGAPSGNQLNRRWTEDAKGFLEKNNFLIEDIRNSKSLLAEVMSYCFESELMDIDSKNINPNKSEYKKEKVKFSALNIEERDCFRARAKWDIKLYQDLVEF